MATCFLCGGEMVPRFKTRDHARPDIPTEYSLEWCANCAFGRLAGEFTPAAVAQFYPADYYTHAAEANNSARPASFSDRLRVHLAWRTDKGIDLSPAEVVSTNPAPSLCDVGCGSGIAMDAFKSAGYQVTGIEPDPKAAALAAKIGEVFSGTAEALPEALAARKFDVVLLSHSLEHCIEPVVALKNVKQLLSADGTAIIEVPNNAALAFERYGPAWFFADIPRHLQFFTEQSLRKALAQAGLRVTRVVYSGYTRQFTPAWLAEEERIRRIIGWPGHPAPWRLLRQTAFAPDAKKYDSIRVHAVHHCMEQTR